MDEIKRLQLELQRAQQSGSAIHRLSERNCVQLVQRLQELGKLTVIHTTDGKQYITPQQLEREISDELYVRGGRMSVAELQDVIGVDISHIEAKVHEMVKTTGSLHLIQGELLNNGYLDTTAEEINDLLQEAGQLSASAMCTRFNLPNEFLQEEVQKRLNRIIYGKMDHFEQGNLFTEAFVARQTAKVRGVFSAVTRPTAVQGLVNTYGIHEKLFHSLLPEMLTSGRLAGTLQGKGDKMVYVPHIYTRAQQRWIDDFFRANNYIEFDAVERLGMNNPKSYLSARFKGGLSLETCHLADEAVSQINDVVQEALASESWVDIKPYLPTPATRADAAKVLRTVAAVKKAGKQNPLEIMADSVVCSPGFLTQIRTYFEPIMQLRAKETIATQKIPERSLSREYEDDSVGAAGIKRKGRRGAAAKSKGKRRNNGDFDEDDQEDHGDHATVGASPALLFLSADEVQRILRKELGEVDEEFILELAASLVGPLHKTFQAVVRDLYLAGSDAAGRRKQTEDSQEKFRVLYCNACLFEQGIAVFQDDEVRLQLSKHLLRTLGNDLVNIIVQLLERDWDDEEEDVEAAQHCQAVPDGDELTVAARGMLIKGLPLPVSTPVQALVDALNRPTLDVTMELAGVYVKRLDKKRERQILFNHKHLLCEQLAKESMPAMCLHLACIILFQRHSQCMLHAPGRCVPQIIEWLASVVEPDVQALLKRIQHHVIQETIASRQSAEGGVPAATTVADMAVDVAALKQQLLTQEPAK